MSEFEFNYSEPAESAVDADLFASDTEFGDPFGAEAAKYEYAPTDEWVPPTQEESLAAQAQLAAYEAQAQMQAQHGTVDMTYLEALAGNATLQTAQMEAASDVADEAWGEQMRRLAAQAGRDAGVTDARSIASAAQSQLDAERECWHRGLAQGATPADMAAAMQVEEFQRWRPEGLAGLVAAHKYEAITANTKMGQWRAERAGEAEAARALGVTPAPSIFERSPSLARMAQSMYARIERDSQRDAAVAARQAESQWWPRRQP